MIPAVAFVSRHFRVFACLTYGIASVEWIAEALLTDGPVADIRAGNLTQYFVSYTEHGFAKRALVGTLLRPVLQAVPNPELAAFCIMIAMSVAGFAALIWLVERFLPHAEGQDMPALLRCALAVGSAGVVQIAHDLGRFDLLNLWLLLAAVVLVLRGTVFGAGLVIAVGILIHEGMLIFGAPLVLALAVQVSGERMWRVALAAVVPAMAAAAVLVWGNSDSAAALEVGFSGYVWARGVFDVRLQLPGAQVAVLAIYWAALLVLLTRCYGASGRRADLLFLAALCPFVMNVFGIDHGRWLTLALMCLILNLTVQVRSGRMQWPALAGWRRGLALVLCLPLGPHGLTGAWAWLF